MPVRRMRVRVSIISAYIIFFLENINSFMVFHLNLQENVEQKSVFILSHVRIGISDIRSLWEKDCFLCRMCLCSRVVYIHLQTK